MALKSKLTALNARNSAPLDRSIFGQPSEDIVETKFKLALHLIEGRDFAGSLRELTLILAKDTTNAEARYYLASIYAGTSRRKQAVVELLKITPDQELFVKSRTFAAFIMRQDGNLDQAEAAVREAYEQDPTDKKVLIYLVAILRDARRFSEAQDLLETALETEPNNDKLLFNYAVVLGDQGKKDQGMEVMEKVIALNPEHSDALNFVAFGLAENDQDLDRALALVTKALETRPNDGFYLDTLGWIYFQQQKFEKAEEVLARAANLSGDDVAILEHHGDALRALNRNQEAFRVYTAALEKARDTENPPADLVEIRGRLEDKLHDVGNLASDTQVQTEHKH